MDLKEIQKKIVSVISLGCDKNRVDLEKMLFNVKEFGFKISLDPTDANVIIINTCGFLHSAIAEALENISQAIKLKKTGVCEKIIVTGCMVARLKNNFPKINGVDAIIDICDNDKIVQKILQLYGIDLLVTHRDGRVLTNVPSYAYIKIADGCDNCCTYCTIPRIRGRYKSEPMEKIISEAQHFADSGVKEIILIAQDVSRYGYDLYGEHKLVPLIRQLSQISGIKWIRLHYLYPEFVTDELLDEIKNNPKLVNYLDIPLQHIDNTILKAMNRKTNELQIRELFFKLKEKYAEISVRSTFIVGFPGETKEQFNKLLDFLKWANISHAGFFAYSREEDTGAYFMKDQIDGKVKEVRKRQAEQVQYEIMEKINLAKVGTIRDIIIDLPDKQNNNYIGRLEEDSPEVDFFVVFNSKNNYKIGDICKVKIYNYENNVFFAEEI